MSIYLYELPTTGAISFSDFCIDQTDGKEHTVHLSHATQARANLRDALKESKRTDRNEKDYLKLVKVLDDYLPQLYGIMSCIDTDEIGLTSEPMFSWRTTLSSAIFNSSPRMTFPSLRADLAFSILTYAFSLSNLAFSTVTSLGTYERQRSISDIERKAKDEKVNFAVTLLCKTSGFFSYLSDTVLLEWESKSGPIPTNRPPDLSRDVVTALAKLSMADAQALAIRKLLSRSAYDSTLTPGPPLPKSHPIPALLGKLHIECAALYSSAKSLAKTPSKSKNKDVSDGEIASDLRRYLSDEAAFHHALSKKWLGIDAGESKGNAKVGEAVAFLTWAKKDLEELKSGGKSLAVGREKEAKGKRRCKIVEELEVVGLFLKHYQKINDSLTFQPVPTQNALQSLIPAGISVVLPKPFAASTPAFGPGSVEYLRRQAEQKLELETEGEAISDERTGTYAGAGSYF